MSAANGAEGMVRRDTSALTSSSNPCSSSAQLINIVKQGEKKEFQRKHLMRGV